jgi:uncharacterized YigZ family protein
MERLSSNNKQDEAANDSYLTITERRDKEIKILASRFLSYALPCRSADAFAAELDALRKEHFNASHHCHAWRIGYGGDTFRYSDDGEPSGTAGKRILGAIDRHGLTDIGIVVVRYFGGTKLGVGGLSRAYADAADAVLAECTIIQRFLTRQLTLTFPYDMTSQVHHVLDMHGIEVAGRRYEEHCIYAVAVRLSAHARFIRDLENFAQRTVTVSEE